MIWLVGDVIKVGATAAAATLQRTLIIMILQKLIQ